MPLVTETAEAYHAHPAFSKSKLWRYHTMTPYRAEFGKTEAKAQFDVGHAAHTAILEPHLLDALIVKGPDDRRGKKWSDWKEECDATGKTLLTSSDYDQVMMIRDAASHIPELEMMRKDAIIERSCYAFDEEYQVEVKCRPDIMSPSLGLMADIKNLSDISDDAWSRDIGKWGYHMQDAMYRHVWNMAGESEVEGFFFICFSKTEPVEVVCRELEDIDVEEGFKAYRAALELAASCRREQDWPSLPTGVVRGVKMRDRDRRFTPGQWNKERDDDVVAD